MKNITDKIPALTDIHVQGEQRNDYFLVVKDIIDVVIKES